MEPTSHLKAVDGRSNDLLAQLSKGCHKLVRQGSLTNPIDSINANSQRVILVDGRNDGSEFVE
jgi:hypothetical protein